MALYYDLPVYKDVYRLSGGRRRPFPRGGLLQAHEIAFAHPDVRALAVAQDGRAVSRSRADARGKSGMRDRLASATNATSSCSARVLAAAPGAGPHAAGRGRARQRPLQAADRVLPADRAGGPNRGDGQLANVTGAPVADI